VKSGKKEVFLPRGMRIGTIFEFGYIATFLSREIQNVLKIVPSKAVNITV
jgi:hypothetical protein